MKNPDPLQNSDIPGTTRVDSPGTTDPLDTAIPLTAKNGRPQSVEHAMYAHAAGVRARQAQGETIRENVGEQSTELMHTRQKFNDARHAGRDKVYAELRQRSADFKSALQSRSS